MTRWHWVRHAPTHQKTFVGWRDVAADLSDQEQIERLNRGLPEQALLVSSDLSRSIVTADALANGRKRLPHVSNFRELHFGTWEGLGFQEIAQKHPDLSRAYWENPGPHRPPGGETWNEAAHRVHSSVRHMNATYPDCDIIVVAHFGVILTQIQRALGLHASEVLHHKIDNFSVTRIAWTGAQAKVETINHIY